MSKNVVTIFGISNFENFYFGGITKYESSIAVLFILLRISCNTFQKLVRSASNSFCLLIFTYSNAEYFLMKMLHFYLVFYFSAMVLIRLLMT